MTELHMYIVPIVLHDVVESILKYPSVSCRLCKTYSVFSQTTKTECQILKNSTCTAMTTCLFRRI
jgi:hypothetical protein